MSKSLNLAKLLLLSTALVAPAAGAQTGGAGQGAAGTGGAPQSATPAADPQTATDPQAQNQAGQAAEDIEISVPGGSPVADGSDIVVTGRRSTTGLVRSAPQVTSILSTADIARTGEGEIAGALQRVTGLSVVGNGFVFVRGLGDRYSLALLNGLPLPSPEPLRRVVPLDIFPTSVIASSLVQKSYSANYPGEFGGGVINLTTRSTPAKPFLSIGGAVGGDSETTGKLGYTYYGSKSDWTGFDSGARDIPGPLKAALNSGNPILAGANFTPRQIQDIAISLNNADTTLLQSNFDIPINWNVDMSGGTSFDAGGATIGVIASGSYSNTWRTRQTLQQTAGTLDLSGQPQTDFNRVITDDRIVVSGLLGLNVEFDRSKLRFTNLYIRDTLKQARLGAGTDLNQAGRDLLRQDTAWYERQLIDSQFTGEFKLGTFEVDTRFGYANTQREAPYERSFTYVRTNLSPQQDPTGSRYVNDLGGSKQGDATIAFSDLDEDLYSGGLDLSWSPKSALTLTGGFAYTRTDRDSTRRAFQFRAANLPITVQQLRPDYLLSDYTIQTYGLTLLETSAQDGTAAFNAQLENYAGYGLARVEPIAGLKLEAGLRYEQATQRVVPIDLFGTGAAAIAVTDLDNDYYLPAGTLTYEVTPTLQVRVSGSKTIARPQFRELVAQVFQDPETNRVFRGNPNLVDSRLTNAESRVEWYFDTDQRLMLGGFYKRIKRPIEVFQTTTDASLNASFANAPEATLYGAELEAQKYVGLEGFGGDLWRSKRLVLIANYTYTSSKLNIDADDTTIVNGSSSAASNFFRDGSPLTGQSDHLVNFQIGLDDTDRLQQFTFLVNYASKRVSSRGPSGQPDIYEYPGVNLDFVAREGIKIAGVDTELKFTARNILGTPYKEYQQAGDNRIFYNRYDLGARFTLGLGVNF